MSTSPSSSAGPRAGVAGDDTTWGPGSPGFTEELERLTTLLSPRTHTSASQTTDGADEADPELVQHLETAYEELRVADEEVRAQQEQISSLVRSRHLGLLQQERTLDLLPVPVLVTDRDGKVRAANGASVQLLQRPAHVLLRRTLAALFVGDDRTAVRNLVSRARAGGEARATLRLLPDSASAPVAVRVSSSGHLGPAAERTWWVLEPVTDDGDEGPRSTIFVALARIAELSSEGGDARTVLHDASRACAEALGPEIGVSLCTGRPVEPTAVGTSSWLAEALDGVQVLAGRGPTVDSYDHDEPVSCSDLRDDERWPRLAERLPQGTGGVVSVPLRSGGRLAGTLTAYVGAGASAPLDRVQLLAGVVGGTLHEVALREELTTVEGQMREAMASRATIEQAKGIVMRTLGVGAEEAWRHLVTLSNEQHLKLRVVAQRIVDVVPQEQSQG